MMSEEIDNTSSVDAVGMDELLDDREALLRHTQYLRLRIADGLMGPNQKTPVDSKEQSNLIKLLTEIDKQEINKARLDLDTKAQQNESAYQQRALAIMESIGNNNPYLNEGNTDIEPHQPGDVELPTEDLEPINDGLLDVGEVPVSFEEVMSKR